MANSKKRENLEKLKEGIKDEPSGKSGFRLEKLFDIGTYASLVERFTSHEEPDPKPRKLKLKETVENFFDKNAKPTIEAVESGRFDKEELEELLDHERENKERKTVLGVIESKLGEMETVEDFFDKNAKPTIEAVESGRFDKEELEELLEHEKEEKERKTVVSAIESKLEEMETVEDFFDKNAEPTIEAVESGRFDRKELKELLEHEREGKERKTVVSAIESKLGEMETVEDFFDKNAKQIIEAVEGGRFSDEELEELLRHEREGKERKTVLGVIEAVIGELPPEAEERIGRIRYQVEVERGRREGKTEVEVVDIEEREEWRGGIGGHKAEVAEEGKENFVARIFEERKERKEGLLSKLVRKVKSLFGLPKEEKEELEEVEGGIIRPGAEVVVKLEEVEGWEESGRKSEGVEEQGERAEVGESSKQEAECADEQANRRKVEEWDVSDISLSEASEKLVTGIDKLFFIVKKKEGVGLEAAAGMLGVTRGKVDEWAKILEDEGLITIHYPAVGEPKLVPKNETRGGSHEIEGD